MKDSCHLIVALLISSLFFNCRSQTSSSIIGEWAFKEFQFEGYLADAPEEQKIQANEKNEGLVITFTKEGKYLGRQSGGLEQNNYTLTYRLINNGKQLVVESDTFTVRLINQYQLELYHSDERPVAVFTRLK